MSGYNTILKIRSLEEELDRLGLKISRSRYNRDLDCLAIVPKEVDNFPILAPDTEFFSGTIEEAQGWVQGFIRARHYDLLIFGKNHNKNREKKEQLYKEEKLIKKLQGAVNSSNVV